MMGANHDGVGNMDCKNKDGVGSDKDGVGRDTSDFFSITSTRNMIIELSENFTYNVANSICNKNMTWFRHHCLLKKLHFCKIMLLEKGCNIC